MITTSSDNSSSVSVLSPKSSWGLVALLLALVIAGGFSYWFLNGYFSRQSTAFNVPQFMLRSGAGNMWYQIAGNTLHSLPGPNVSTKFTGSIVEVAAPRTNGIPVLASLLKNGKATRFGFIYSGVFMPFIPDSTEKQDLTVRPDGLIAFSEFQFSTSKTGITSSAWNIVTVDLASTTKPTLTVLGEGRDPVFMGNGNILAFGSEGLIEINPKTSVRTVLQKAPGTTSNILLIAPSGTFVVIPNAVTNTEDVFSMDSNNPANRSYIGSLPSMPVALGAVSPTQFVAETSTATATLYTISNGKLISSGTLAVSP